MKDLAELARAATPGPWTSDHNGYVWKDGKVIIADCGEHGMDDYIAACSPERILALLAIKDAAKVKLKYSAEYGPFTDALNAALAAYEALK